MSTVPAAAAAAAHAAATAPLAAALEAAAPCPLPLSASPAGPAGPAPPALPAWRRQRAPTNSRRQRGWQTESASKWEVGHGREGWGGLAVLHSWRRSRQPGSLPDRALSAERMLPPVPSVWATLPLQMRWPSPLATASSTWCGAWRAGSTCQVRDGAGACCAVARAARVGLHPRPERRAVRAAELNHCKCPRWLCVPLLPVPSDKRQFVSELCRVCAPGGRIIVVRARGAGGGGWVCWSREAAVDSTACGRRIRMHPAAAHCHPPAAAACTCR